MQSALLILELTHTSPVTVAVWVRYAAFIPRRRLSGDGQALFGLEMTSESTSSSATSCLSLVWMRDESERKWLARGPNMRHPSPSQETLGYTSQQAFPLDMVTPA